MIIFRSTENVYYKLEIPRKTDFFEKNVLSRARAPVWGLNETLKLFEKQIKR